MSVDRSEELLATLEAYYDAVPRTAARAEASGPFVLFVNDGPGWRYYARPRLGAASFDAADVQRMRARQRELGVPESVEWVAETTPGLRAAVEVAGLRIADYPLMVLGEPVAGDAPPGVEVRLAAPADDLALLSAVAVVGFSSPGTAAGPAGAEDVARLAAARDPGLVAFERERLRSGRTVMAVALADGAPVAVGSHQPVGSVSEVVGVATLPSHRRRGIAAALTARLASDALERGARTIFLSAGDESIARVYGRLGFVRVGTACVAEPS